MNPVREYLDASRQSENERVRRGGRTPARRITECARTASRGRSARDRLAQAIADPACRSCNDGSSRRGCRRRTRLRHERSPSGARPVPPGDERAAGLRGGRHVGRQQAGQRCQGPASSYSPRTRSLRTRLTKHCTPSAVKTFDTLKLIDTVDGNLRCRLQPWCHLEPSRSPLRHGQATTEHCACGTLRPANRWAKTWSDTLNGLTTRCSVPTVIGIASVSDDRHRTAMERGHRRTDRPADDRP